MGRPLLSNLANTTLAAGISDTATEITVADGSEFPAPTGDNYAYLTLEYGAAIEIVKLTARDGNTLTVERAFDGTSATAFSSTATTVSLRLPKILFEEVYEQRVFIVTSDFTFDIDGRVRAVDTTNNEITGTLPPTDTPLVVGHTVRFSDFANFGLNKFIIAPNTGQTIEGLAENFNVRAKGTVGGAIYEGSNNWRLF